MISVHVIKCKRKTKTSCKSYRKYVVPKISHSYVLHSKNSCCYGRYQTIQHFTYDDNTNYTAYRSLGHYPHLSPFTTQLTCSITFLWWMLWHLCRQCMFLQRYIRQTRTHACESLRTKRYENYNFLLYLMIIKKYKTLILRWEYQYLKASQYKYKEI